MFFAYEENCFSNLFLLSYPNYKKKKNKPAFKRVKINYCFIAGGQNEQ